jgi:hypothetical protein
MKTFFRWLFPAYYNPYAKCRACGRTGLKTEMFYISPVYGWFCNKEEAGVFWEEAQW